MDFNPETETMKASVSAAKVAGSPDGTPNIVSLTKALLLNLMDRIKEALATDEYPHHIEVSHTWENKDGGDIAGGRLTLTLDVLDADEYAEAQAEIEAAGVSTEN